jgi:DNA-binding response OmpR family regulator
MILALLVDDDKDLAALLAEYLSAHEVEVDHAGDGAAGLAKLAARAYDVVLLDVMLPGADGFEICEKVRARSLVPVIMLTARGDDADRIVGLELGADDYVPKPFNPRELLARIRAVVRRSAALKRPDADHERVVVGDLVLDVGQHKVFLAGAEITLTSFEFRVLLELARRAGEAVGREELAAAVKGGAYDPSVDRSLDVHVSHLRQKIEEDPKEPRRIKTIRAVGYMLSRPS